ncbi:unnamed protein product [Calypogeia fissa]
MAMASLAMAMPNGAMAMASSATTVPSGTEQHHGLEETILSRKSIRKFVSTPVPRHLLMEALELARHAPSNSNIQPWRLYIAEGDRRDRLREELLAECKRGPPQPYLNLPEEYRKFRSELGAQVYGAMGVKHDDKEARAKAVLRNWEFFGAPVMAIVCLHRDLRLADAISVGMFVQTLILALTARGISSCCQASIAMYPDVIRKELNIPLELNIICGISIGYADMDFAANHVSAPRAPLEDNVTILDS